MTEREKAFIAGLRLYPERLPEVVELLTRAVPRLEYLLEQTETQKAESFRHRSA